MVPDPEKPLQTIAEGKNPRISVVIPAHKTASSIANCLDSVFAQSFRDFEVIVINDGSPDTEDLEKNLQPYANRTRYLKQSNRGPSAARNLGIREARGEYIAFLDSDDTWLSQHLATQMAILGADPTLGLVYGDSLLTRNGEPLGRTFDREEQVLPVEFETLLAEKCTVTTSATVASRQDLMDAGLFDESLHRAEDFDLWLRMAFRGTRMTHHRELTVCRTVSGSGLSASAYLMTLGRLEVLAKTGAQLPLSPESRHLLAERIRETEKIANLHRLKEHIRNGEFDAALDAAHQAASVHDTLKLRFVVFFLQYAPRALQACYRAYEPFLAARTRARAARSARVLRATLPSLFAKVQDR
jgi:hypothetical protein